MRFYAKLDTDAVLERPLQTFSQSMDDINSWAKHVLASASAGSTVRVFECLEKEVATFSKGATA